ncbi:MAG: cation-translocating P-type ATPase [Proteobacteria bacterium]|nr:cation-translocating P-type ATPase [Pseudomonadota bacterium]MBU1965404.1 cation-translocating P-type ATPase [Pseudomonadota bacterium]MBU4372004.1 cation-translocating P-type ATPase [Pseudomonadota bacterium]MBU4581227.1 cation-translocating P-type ATPase [Pseudomonadota bacterium]
MMETGSHEKSIDEVVRGLHTDLAMGLSEVEARVRLRKYGPNELRERPRPGFFALLLDQFNNFLVIILIVAAVVTVLLGEYIDAIAITVIIVLNAVLGVIQESKAEQAIAGLKKMAAPHAQVVRDGRQTSIPGRKLVVGDIVLLEAGNYVPADMRLVESINLKVEEASLTGESLPVEKSAKVVLDKEVPLGDRKNTVFMSTLITYGRGRGVVTGTGMETQIGLIAEMIQSYVEEDTPLQQKLAHLGKVLGTACLAICGFVFIYGLIRDTNLTTAFQDGFIHYLLAEQKVIIGLFMIAISLAIAAVPEGLPAIVTICLAIGMQQMIKRHALIRKLAAVETLGSTTVICTDKTGTLTQNQMTVLQGWTGGRGFQVTGKEYAPTGLFTRDGQGFDPQGDADVAALLRGGLLCNDADLVEGGKETSWRITGDPTEGALVVAAAKAGVRRADIAKVLPRVAEIPFDSDRKRMTTIHRYDPTVARTGTPAGFSYPPVVAFVKGAPDFVLDLCSRVLQDGQAVSLTEEKRQEILERNREMAGNALRVLAVAYRPLDAVPENADPDQVEKDLTFIGLLGMIDPPRPEVIAAMRVARGAGLKTIMVTGDYRETAEAVAREIGLRTPGGLVLTGTELDQINDERLTAEADRLDVCCRVSPAHKTRIVDALKARGHIVAMTGDGVNDAPALKRANIGIAMGITGTDVSKAAADIVLTDDNFASIVSAVEQGRIIYSNIRKFVYFLLACNVGEILIVFCAMLMGLPIPLRPIHLLWLNLISDGAPALALGMEKGEPDTMRQPPRPPAEPLVNTDMKIGISVVAVVDAIAILLVFYLGMGRYPGQIEAAQTMAFVTLSVSELVRAFTARSEYLSVFKIGVFSSRWMVGATVVSFLLVLTVVYVPFLQPFFYTVTLTPDDWFFMLPFFFASAIAMELVKIYIRHKRTMMVRERGDIVKTEPSQKEV